MSLPSLRARRTVSLVVALAVAHGGSLAAQAPAAAPDRGRIEQLSIHSPSLEGNLLGDPADQSLAVYLPPGYGRDPSRRYPVLYLLHGIGGNFTDWTEDWEIGSILDRLIAERSIGELLVVMPNGGNAYSGSFYMSSPVTGDWEAYIAKEVVALVDRQFRTVAAPEGRGLAGHSMGGFGAIHLGMRHPDVFGSVYAMSPCCLDVVEDIAYGNHALAGALKLRSRDELPKLLEEGDFYPVALIALAAVFSPNPDRPPFFVDFPFKSERGELLPDLPVHDRWLAQAPVHQVPRYLPKLRRLRAIALDYGTHDQFAHIPVATANFSRALADHRVPHNLDVFAGDHRQQMPERLEQIVLPFFSRQFFGGGLTASTAPRSPRSSGSPPR
jgi:S-formylglutathione hydrolase